MCSDHMFLPAPEFVVPVEVLKVLRASRCLLQRFPCGCAASPGLEAKKQGTTKAALIRLYVRRQLGTPDHGNDALAEMVGADEFDPVPIDDVVYR